MAIVRADEIFPRLRRQPGGYTSREVTLPADATYLTAIADSRALWDPRGARETVLSLEVQAFVEGAWIVLGGFTTDASVKLAKDGSMLAASSIRVRLPRTRAGTPPVRTLLQCASACTGAVTLIFDDLPPPVRQAQEHRSVTYDNDNEVVGGAVNSVTIGAFAVGNNANRCMLVGQAAYDSAAGDTVISTINHNGSTAGWASVITDTGPGGTTNRASIWRKIAPDAVSSTVVVTCVGTCTELAANALSVYDVDQTTPTAGAVAAEGTSSPATGNVSAATDDLVYDATYFYGASQTWTVAEGAGQTARANLNIITYSGAASKIGCSTEPGAATVTMSWANDTGAMEEWVKVACAIKVAAAAPPSFVPRPFRLTQAVHRAATY